jgi:hypothetical protein
MRFSFSVSRRPDLPALAFAAEIVAGRREIYVQCGEAVEVDDLGLLAGAWAGPFEQRAIERAVTSVGTALRSTGDRLIAVAGTASASVLFFCRSGSRLIVSNGLALSLAAANDRLVASHPFYPQDLCTFIFGSDRYRHTVPTESGQLSVHYGPMAIERDFRLTPVAASAPPAFPDFASYREYLLDQMRSVFANAADPARRCRYRPIVALSAGYDSPAAAVMAHEAGCTEGFTFRQPVDRPGTDEDSGAAIARTIGLGVQEYDTFSYRQRSDLPEIEFIASSFGGGQVYLAATGNALSGRIVVSGYGGDRVWDKAYGLGRWPQFPFYSGGYSQAEFFARAPALDFSVPLIGARGFADIGAISRSAAMQSWSVGGDYDRPIPRRITEQAGVPRGSFAVRKRRVTPDYDNLTRRAIDLDRFLSPVSRAAFEKWFATERPIDPRQAFWHRLLSGSVGRILWSGKLMRALDRCGISWPPFPARLLRLKVPIRSNAFVFNWAVSEQVRRYRAILSRDSETGEVS